MARTLRMAGPAIIDTNVVIAGLLTDRADSPVARILDGMLAATFPFVLSEPLLAEYYAVLRRPALRKAHGLSPAEIDIILVDIAHRAIVLEPVAAPPAPEPGDQHLWSLLAARDDLMLVTGDKLLRQDADMASRILLPAEFVERWRP